MTDSTQSGLFAKIDRLFVINLESRPDRRREMLDELARIGLDAENPGVEFFAAVKPDAADNFPSIGARGCFLSHLGVLRNARAAGYRAILILEDDAALTSRSRNELATALQELDGTGWALAYLGHRIAPNAMPGANRATGTHWRALSPGTRVETTHAMMIHGQAFEALIAYLERMMARPAGDPNGGPMHVDGAYSWFRRDHPEFTTLVTPAPYVLQRASKSDIAPATWKDNLPFLALFRRVRNRLSGDGPRLD
jgi:hypothetical protein